MAPKAKPPTSRPPAAKPADPAKGERIAKVLSRRGIASRREAERLIELGEVAVNGRVIDSPALNVTPKDRITVSGQPLPEKEPARLWLYYKPEGLVTSAADEKGRDTVFDHLPEDMPRVMSVGRLDLNSEGLLLLTNDGELKRRLELPSTGWLRKYRVRVNGNPTDDQLEPLRRGITVEGERFQPMQVTLDRVQGANAWLTVGLREGKNREIRRAMSAINLYVNRLIRISYGPFRLNELQPGEVEEIRPRVLRDQLGEALDGGATETEEDRPKRPAPRSYAPTSKAGPKAPPKAEAKPRRPAAPRSGEDRGIEALARSWDAATAAKPATRRTPSRSEDEAAPRGPRIVRPRGTAEASPRVAREDAPARKPAAPSRTRTTTSRADDRDDTPSRKPASPSRSRTTPSRSDDRDAAPSRAPRKPAPTRSRADDREDTQSRKPATPSRTRTTPSRSDDRDAAPPRAPRKTSAPRDEAPSRRPAPTGTKPGPKGAPKGPSRGGDRPKGPPRRKG